MRKIVTLLVFIGLLLSCEEHYRTNQVINNSDYEVTFTFNHFREIEYTLKPHTSDYYSEKVSIKRYSAIPPRVSYNYDYKNQITEFFNTSPRQVKIINELDRDILVTALGTMNNEPITVSANDEFNGSIYNSNPVFSGVTTSNSFPVNFTHSTNGLTVRAHW